MKIFKLILMVALLGLLGAIATQGWGGKEEAEGFVRYGDRLARYKKNWRKAIYAYQRALEIDPGNARAHLGLGRVFLQRKEKLRAAEEFEAALSLARSQDLELFEERSDAMNYYLTAASLMVEELKQPDRARPFLDMAREIYPDDDRLKKLEEETRRIKESGEGKAAVVEGFVLHLDVPDQKEMVRPVIRVLDEARVLLTRAFDFRPEKPFTLIILTRLPFENQARLFLEGSEIGSRNRIVIQTRGADARDDIFKEVLFHQYGRLWLSAYLEYDPPRWLSDGFAAWSQKFAVGGSIHVPRTAMESYRMVDYLMGQSRVRFHRFLEDLKSTRDLPLTLQNNYGISVEELQSRGKL